MASSPSPYPFDSCLPEQELVELSAYCLLNCLLIGAPLAGGPTESVGSRPANRRSAYLRGEALHELRADGQHQLTAESRQGDGA
jgi:hypothetical protein